MKDIFMFSGYFLQTSQVHGQLTYGHNVLEVITFFVPHVNSGSDISEIIHFMFIFIE